MGVQPDVWHRSAHRELNLDVARKLIRIGIQVERDRIVGGPHHLAQAPGRGIKIKAGLSPYRPNGEQPGQPQGETKRNAPNSLPRADRHDAAGPLVVPVGQLVSRLVGRLSGPLTGPFKQPLGTRCEEFEQCA